MEMEQFLEWFLPPAAILMATAAILSFVIYFYILFFCPQCPCCDARKVEVKKYRGRKWVGSDVIPHVPKETEGVITTKITCLACGAISFKRPDIAR